MTVIHGNNLNNFEELKERQIQFKNYQNNIKCGFNKHTHTNTLCNTQFA